MTPGSPGVLVTGGSAGIGRAVAGRFGEGGYRVAITGRNQAALDEAVAELRERGIEAVGLVSSAADPEAIAGLFADLDEAMPGGVDAVVLNAGIGPERPLLETEVESWDEIMDLNLRGAFLATREAGRYFVARGKAGVILVTGSINATFAEPPATTYCVSKAGLEMLVRGAAIELAEHDIRVCGVHPGYIDTPMLAKVYGEELEEWVAERRREIPVRRLGRPEEIANAFFFLASAEASYITGTSLVVDGGRTAR